MTSSLLKTRSRRPPDTRQTPSRQFPSTFKTPTRQSPNFRHVWSSLLLEARCGLFFFFLLLLLLPPWENKVISFSNQLKLSWVCKLEWSLTKCHVVPGARLPCAGSANNKWSVNNQTKWEEIINYRIIRGTLVTSYYKHITHVYYIDIAYCLLLPIAYHMK